MKCYSAEFGTSDGTCPHCSAPLSPPKNSAKCRFCGERAFNLSKLETPFLASELQKFVSERIEYGQFGLPAGRGDFPGFFRKMNALSKKYGAAASIADTSWYLLNRLSSDGLKQGLSSGRWYVYTEARANMAEQRRIEGAVVDAAELFSHACLTARLYHGTTPIWPYRALMKLIPDNGERLAALVLAAERHGLDAARAESLARTVIAEGI